MSKKELGISSERFDYLLKSGRITGSLHHMGEQSVYKIEALSVSSYKAKAEQAERQFAQIEKRYFAKPTTWFKQYLMAMLSEIEENAQPCFLSMGSYLTIGQAIIHGRLYKQGKTKVLAGIGEGKLPARYLYPEKSGDARYRFCAWDRAAWRSTLDFN